MLNDLRRQGISFVSLTEGIDTETAGGRMFYAMLAAFAEYEADTIAERTKAGLEAAKRRGVKLGKPESTTAEQRKHIQTMHAEGANMATIAHTMNVPYHTVRRVCGRMA